MKVVHVVPSISDEASGLACIVPSLCSALSEQGVDVGLDVLSPGPRTPPAGVDLHVHPVSYALRRLGWSSEMSACLRKQARAEADVIHVHSLWRMPTVYPAQAVKGTGCKLVFSPHGTLSPWALRYSSLQKRLMWAACQSRTATQAHLLHASSNHELKDLRRLRLHQPAAVIPNGVAIPELPPLESVPGRAKRLLYLGRIHPIKGITNLLHAWHAVEAEFADWELVVAGADGGDGYIRTMRQEAEALGVQRVQFPGPVYGSEKAQTYAGANLYVLPTQSENFGMTVAEALAHGVPVIVTTRAPWGDVAEKGCGWWIDFGVEPLATCLRHVLSLSEWELRARGARGRRWMEEAYSWRNTAVMMERAYRWLLHGGAMPECVSLVEDDAARN
jgi:glycosyltransferase involved in cell wall biosynthesis